MLTPAARDFLRERRITLKYISQNQPVPSDKVMSRTPIPVRDGKVYYVNTEDGSELSRKPEELTHLRGNLLVSKIHPRIEFRGRIDSLIAYFMEVELIAEELGEAEILKDLETLLEYVKKILGAEVKDEPLEDIRLLGMDSKDIRYNSHNVKKTIGIDHPIPHYTMGRMCVALNRLRAEIREVELSAAHAFYDEEVICTRKDIIEGLNRLSSCVYILFCRKFGGYYDGRDKR